MAWITNPYEWMPLGDGFGLKAETVLIDNRGKGSSTDEFPVNRSSLLNPNRTADWWREVKPRTGVFAGGSKFENRPEARLR